MTRSALRRDLEAYLFLLPWLLGLLLFRVGPMLASILLSFAEWDVLKPPRWIGLENYVELVKDPLFWRSLANTAYYVGGRVPLVLLGALGIALLLQRTHFATKLYRTIFYLPTITPAVSAALLWAWMYDPFYGVINTSLAAIGIKGPHWLASPEWAMPALILMNVWGIGTTMVIYLAGLQGVPTQLYEAAEIDGAGRWRKVWHITLPMVTPVIFFNLVMGIIASFQVFVNAHVMTGGGPANATLVYVLYLYKHGFSFLHMGYASALAWVLFLIIFVLTVLTFRSSGWVYYEGRAR
jgi:multiple sugar transport system permease protein